MPIIKSAQKRMRQEQVRRERNLGVKRDVKTKSKAFESALATKDSKKITKAQNELYSSLDTATKKNIIHKNKAARKKSAASSKAKAAGVKISSTKSSKSTSTKAKTTTKKTSTKK